MNLRFAAPLLLFATILAGCGANVKQDTAPDGDAHGHSHPSAGPHGGSLIELGNQAYHAEILHDESDDRITIYLLDSTAKTPVAISAPDLTINVKREAGGVQFLVTAAPDTDDAEGTSSRFEITDAALMADIESDTPAQLVVKIEDAQYRGDIEHTHDHEHGHDHDH
jgi:hypothetical protein